MPTRRLTADSSSFHLAVESLELLLGMCDRPLSDDQHLDSTQARDVKVTGRQTASHCNNSSTCNSQRYYDQEDHDKRLGRCLALFSRCMQGKHPRAPHRPNAKQTHKTRVRQRTMSASSESIEPMRCLQCEAWKR